MSRKRERQRENRRELARQLGVGKDEVPDKLIAHERVTEPTLKPRLAVAEDKRGLLKRGGPIALHLALFVIDRGGGQERVRLARLMSMRGTVSRPPSEPALEVALRGGPEVVRYARPGRFLAVALLTTLEDEALVKAHAAALSAPERLQLVVEGATSAIAEGALGRLEGARAARVLVDGAPLVDESRTRGAAAMLSIAAAHRVHETVTLPLASEDGRLGASLTLELRL